MHQNSRLATCLVQQGKVYGTMVLPVGGSIRWGASVQLLLELAFLAKTFRSRLLIEHNLQFLGLQGRELLWSSPPLLSKPLQMFLHPWLTLNSSSKFKTNLHIYFLCFSLLIWCYICSVLVLFCWSAISRLVVEKSNVEFMYVCDFPYLWKKMVESWQNSIAGNIWKWDWVKMKSWDCMKFSNCINFFIACLNE